MADIYVKWASLKSSANNICNYKKSLNKCCESVQNIVDTLYMSPNISGSITSSLRRDLSDIMHLSEKIGRYGSFLDKIAETYELSESGLVK